MESSGIESSSLSGERQKAGEGMRAKREIKHFSEETGTEYGPEWKEVVNVYLKAAYEEADKGCDLEVAGAVYRALRRDKVTAFYDSDGVTLFDVTNERLAKEYESLKNNDYSGDEEPAPEEQEEKSENTEDVKERAKEKLKDELENAGDKSFADPVISYLLERCEEDRGLSEDVLQDHKSWEKCLDYIYSRAEKQASGIYAAVRDEVVYEWAEDYYHKDDKAEEAEKTKKAAESKKKMPERAARAKANTGKPKTENKAAQKKQKSHIPAEKVEEKQNRRNGKDLEGQMDMFSMMGI